MSIVPSQDKSLGVGVTVNSTDKVDYRFLWVLARAITHRQHLLEYVKNEDERMNIISRSLRLLAILSRRIEEAGENQGIDVTISPSENITPEKPGPIVDVFFCCYCDVEASGRWVFMGKKGKPVANPFCQDHMNLVYEQTQLSLKEMHQPVSIHYALTILQQWIPGGAPPPSLPKNHIELIRLGSSKYHV